ncbi:MAG: hypothetical protein LBI99_09135 [Propionibacteriaceae bacterium]|nr:hypothetical protein [Propionibacteriaceae bacterium]
MPTGYQAVAKQGDVDSFPLDAKYSVFYYQSSPSDMGDSAISNDNTFLFDFTNAEEGVVRMGDKVVTLDQLNATLESQCR